VQIAPEPAPAPANEGETDRADDDDAELNEDADSSSSKYGLKTLYGLTPQQKTQMMLDELATPSVFESQPWWWTPVGCFRRMTESRTRRLASSSQDAKNSHGSVTVKSVDAIYNVCVFELAVVGTVAHHRHCCSDCLIFSHP
jgi:hypothetical protein